MMILDRFEEDFAVVEIDGKTVNVEIKLVMDDVKEGDEIGRASCRERVL